MCSDFSEIFKFKGFQRYLENTVYLFEMIKTALRSAVQKAETCPLTEYDPLCHSVCTQFDELSGPLVHTDFSRKQGTKGLVHTDFP